MTILGIACLAPLAVCVIWGYIAIARYVWRPLPSWPTTRDEKELQRGRLMWIGWHVLMLALIGIKLLTGGGA